MKIRIRQHRSSDGSAFLKLVEQLQDYLVSVDDMKRLRRMPEYGESYTRRTLEKVAKNNGIIYIAKTEGRLVGLVVGIIPEQTREDPLE
jgi:hypothetical protein